MYLQHADELEKEVSSIGSLLSKYKFNQKTTKHRNQRAELIEQFQVEINKERVEEDGRLKDKRYKKLSYVAVLKKVEHLKDPDLYIFYKDCMDGKQRRGSFSKVFFGALKVKRPEK